MHGSPPTQSKPLLGKIGRRSAARLRLSVPAKFISLYEARNCTLLDVSRTGARIELDHPLVLNDAGFLRCAGVEVFACVLREKSGVNGLEFDLPLSDNQVLAIRSFSENLERDERSSVWSEARAWATGGH
ncbi:MAG: PilZ domain-containing protein [Pseudomonadota bacterium]